MRTAIYQIVGQPNKNSTNELTELKNFCQSAGHEIVEIYQDEDCVAKRNRPGYMRLVEDAGVGKWELVVVFKLSHIGRSLRQLLRTLDSLRAYEIDFISFSDSAFNTIEGSRLMGKLVTCLVDFERSIVSERTKSVLRLRKNQGAILGRPRKVDHKRLLDLRAQGLSLAEIGKVMKCDRTTISKALKAHEGHISGVN